MCHEIRQKLGLLPVRFFIFSELQDRIAIGCRGGEIVICSSLKILFSLNSVLSNIEAISWHPDDAIFAVARFAFVIFHERLIQLLSSQGNVRFFDFGLNSLTVEMRDTLQEKRTQVFFFVVNLRLIFYSM